MYSVELFSDLHKDVNGFRPTIDHKFYAVSDPESGFFDPEEAERIWNYYITELEEQCAAEEIRRKQCVVEFEEWIEELIGMGAGDRFTAIRWVIDTYDQDDYVDYILWDLNLPHTYADEFNAVFESEKVA
jgi:hypothetical protein